MAFHYSPKIPTRGLTVYLDSSNPKSIGNQSSWGDISGNGYNATKSGTPNYTTLGGVNTWEFNSDGDFFLISNAFSGLTATTLESWIYPGASEVTSGDRGTIMQGTIYMSWNKSNRRLSSYWYSTNNQGYHEPSLQMAREEWHHLLTVWTGSQLLQYINGNLEKTVDTTISNGSISRLIIGRESSGRQFSGGISVIKMYNVALTPQEVADCYNGTKSRFGR